MLLRSGIRWVGARAMVEARSVAAGARWASVEAAKDRDAPSAPNRPSPASLRRLLSFAYEERWPLAVATATVAGTSSISLAFPYALGRIVDASLLTNVGSGWSPGSISMALMGLFVVQTGLIVWRSSLVAISGEKIAARLRARTFEALLRQEVAFFDEARTGELMNRLSSDSKLVQSAITSNVTNGIRSASMAVGGAAMLFYLSPALAALSLCLIPPVGLGGRYFGQFVKQRQEAVQKRLGETLQVAEEVVSNIRTVRQFAAEPREALRFATAVRAAYGESRAVALAQAWFDGGVHLAANAALIAVLWYGGSQVQGGVLTAGDLTSFLMYALYTGFNITQLSSVYAELMRGVGASQRLLDILDREPRPATIPASSEDVATAAVAVAVAVAEPSAPALGTALAAPAAAAAAVVAAPAAGAVPLHGARLPVLFGQHRLESVRGEVVFEDVHFSYPTRRDVPVLRGVTLRVAPGEVLGVAGPSGCGKSTLAALLTRLYEPTSGAITIDGVPLTELDPLWLRGACVAVVPQDPVLFATSIRDNILYARPDASQADVLRAAEVARADSFIRAFPNAYDTLVGERGVRLSGGQKQRIAIARAVLKNAPILVADEATSALDAESEGAVAEALGVAMRGRTVLTIAHRLSTLRTAQRVAVIGSDGTVAEQGPLPLLLATQQPASRDDAQDQGDDDDDDEEDTTIHGPGALRKLLRRQLLDTT